MPFAKDHDGHGRELFCNGGQKELRVRRDGGAGMEISEPENPAVLDPPVADEHGGHSRRVLLFPVVQQGVEARGQRLRMNVDTQERDERHASHHHDSHLHSHLAPDGEGPA